MLVVGVLALVLGYGPGSVLAAQAGVLIADSIIRLYLDARRASRRPRA